jgi:hypothetical protein
MSWSGLKPDSSKELSRSYHESSTISLRPVRPARSVGRGGPSVVNKVDGVFSSAGSGYKPPQIPASDWSRFLFNSKGQLRQKLQYSPFHIYAYSHKIVCDGTGTTIQRPGRHHSPASAHAHPVRRRGMCMRTDLCPERITTKDFQASRPVTRRGNFDSTPGRHLDALSPAPGPARLGQAFR